MKQKIKDNPNPKANIAFICFVPLNYYVYKNIYEHLPNAEFVVGESYDTPTFGQVSTENPDRMIKFFSALNVRWRYISHQDSELTPKEFYDKYAVLISTWYRGPLSAAYNQDKKLVRVMYGHAKDLWNYGPWSAFFDLVLAYGDYSQKYLSTYGNSTIVGNPKFDDWFSQKVSNRKIKTRLNPDKKTILYTPTHAGLSSIPYLISDINKASLEFNIIVKVHHNTYLYEPNLLEPLKDNPAIILENDEADILPLLKVSDVVISDNSGAIFDAVLADKPLVLLDSLGDVFFETYKEGLFYRIDGQHQGVQTTKESIEQLIKEPGKEIGPVIPLPISKRTPTVKKQVSYESFKYAIEKALAEEKVYQPRRAKIKQLSFAHTDGKSGQLAAEKISNLLTSPKAEPSFLSLAIKRYRDENVFSPPKERITNDENIKADLKEAVKLYSKIRSLPFLQRFTFILKEFFF